MQLRADVQGETGGAPEEYLSENVRTHLDGRAFS